MTYAEVFGGGTINPAQRTYLSIVTAVDITLQWPTNTVGGDDVAADIIDVDATQPGVDISLSDARQVSNGFTSLFVNVGSQDFQVLDALGATIVSPASAVGGTAWFIYLTDNSTEDGTWATFQLGATVSVADAAALAGAGIKAITDSLNQSILPTLEAASPIVWTDANRALFSIWTGGVGVLDLPTPASVGSDWFGIIRNEGSGTLTVTPAGAETIDSAATLIMNPGESAFIITDGFDWFTVGLGSSSTVGFDFVQIDVSGSGDFILSGVQLNRISYEFIGALTGTRKIVVPNTIQQYWVANFTTGAFTFEVATAAQVTPLQITQNNRSIFYCDGNDVVDAETGTLTPPISIGQGGTSATNAVDALNNLGGISSARIVGTAADSGLAGGGDLTVDRDLVLDIDNLVLELTPDPLADVVAFFDDDAVATVKIPMTNLIAGQLADNNGNIRVSAETGGNVQIRSDSNSDSVPRRLLFTHQDGTQVGIIGWDSFSQEMFIQNNINNADGTIEISTTHISAEIIVGGLRTFSAGLQVRGGNTAAINLSDNSWNNLARIGFSSSNVLRFENGPQEDIVFEGEDSITATVSMLEMNPNTGCHLFFKGDGEVARTRLLVDGGFEVNNTVTGAGFERVLTVGDVSTGSFTGTITGVTVLTQGTIEWMRITAADGNDLIILSCDADIVGTSNTTQMTMTGIPLALRPSSDRSAACFVRNEAKFTNALAQVDSGGAITFYAPDNTSNTTNPFWSFTTFGNVGSKGLEQGWHLIYRLN